MNKKFSTLLAGVMLASAFTVGAQTEVRKYETGKGYLLGTATGYVLSASSDQADFGALEAVKADDVEKSLKNTSECLWIATVTQGTSANAPKYVFVNKATGLILSVDPNAADETTKIVPNKISGSATEWLNTSITDAGEGNTLPASPLYSYYGDNKVVYFDLTGGALVIKVGTPAEAQGKATIAPLSADIIKNLTAEDLNTQLRTAKEDCFNLSFNRDVTSAGSNLFANTSLIADQIANSDYVRLIAKDKKVKNADGEDVDAYIVVDTVYHRGTEAVGALVKFTYANSAEKENANGIERFADSYAYNFSYDPNKDRLLIKSKGYLKKTDKKENADKTTTEWYENTTVGKENVVADAFIRLAELTSARELTVATGTESTSNPDNKEYGMLTNVKIGVSSNTYVPTTVASGLYLIKLHTADAKKDTDGSYKIANLAGTPGYALQARNQEFAHMPAAQWYVKQQGATSTSPIKVTNREFGYDLLTGVTMPSQAFAAGNYVFFANGDTLEFIAVDKATKEDKYLGYKHVTKEEASVETYVFNYLSGLTLEKGLNTPAGKDSVVRVDETGAKAQFVLIPVIQDDSYGIQTKIAESGIANLVRNVYYVKAYDSSKFGGEARYLTYDAKLKKYVMSTMMTPFFLKENNCIEGDPYYTLVETVTRTTTNIANTYYPAVFAGKKSTDDDVKAYALTLTDIPVYDANGKLVVKDDSKIAIYAYKADATSKEIKLTKVADDNQASSVNYASVKVSVDDNTLDLTQGILNDKFSSEIRTSAFAVVKDDSPLYRRFNGVAPEEFGDAANSPLNLKFFRSNNMMEFLAENSKATNSYRDGLKDKSISFLGVNNAAQFKEADSLSYTIYVDTAYVRYSTRMPQYLLAIRPDFVQGDTIWCKDPNHKTHADSINCYHTKIYPSFTRAQYLINAMDSVDNAKNGTDYQWNDKYTRLAFVDAIHANDTLYILKNKGLANDQIDFRNAALFAQKIALDNNKHKNCVFSFRLIDDNNNRFLIESETENGAGAWTKNAKLESAKIAPVNGGWVKIQNGVPVIAQNMSFNEAIAQAEIFDVNNDIKFAPTSTDDADLSNVVIIAEAGAVRIQGAAGMTVEVSTILGKGIASKVLASDNETISAPAGVVLVTVNGETVKAIVK